MSNLRKPKLRKIARVHDETDDSYFDVIEFRTTNDKIKRLEVSPLDISNEKAFGGLLLNADALLPKDPDRRKTLLTSIADIEAADRWKYSAHTGFTRGHKAYVFHDGFVGKSKVEILGVRAAKPSEKSPVRRSVNGDAASWAGSVGQLAQLSTALTLCVSAAFAAPLLSFLNRGSFAIHLTGPSRSGKSIATLAGASVVGIATVHDLLNWNTTDAALEERLAEFNDGLCPIDDIETLRGKSNSQKCNRIRELAYGISQGSSKGRHSSFQKKHAPTWHVIALTSGEKTIQDRARSAKQHRQYGEAVRLIDQSVLFDGRDHIFDLARDKFESEAAFQAWKAATFKAIINGCADNHGATFRAFIKALIDQRDKVRMLAEKHIARFRRHVCEDIDGDLARDLAEKYGLLYAGGMFAIRYGLVPWRKRRLRLAIAKAYRAARDLLPDDGVLCRQGLHDLREKLKNLPRLEGAAAEQANFDELGGYRQRKKGHQSCVVRNEVFNSIFESAEQCRLVTEWLVNKGRATLAAPKTASGSQTRKQIPWPDGKRRRSIRITWPLKV
jgi:hypothetical protein